MSSSKEKIFECVKLLEVEESEPAAGGETPTHGVGKILSVLGVGLANLAICLIFYQTLPLLPPLSE